jgi:ABC-type phosphate/phosphonate transport system substrate-binding protein
MFRSKRTLMASAFFALVTVPAFLPAPIVVAEENVPVKIGLPANLFRDIPKFTIDALMPTFTKLMESQTGIRGQLVMLKGGDEVGKQLNENKIQYAVFHGFEFAWEQNKYKDLKPLVIAIANQSPRLTAQVVVASDSSYLKLDDLKGQKVAIPRGTREHCRLFLTRRLHGIGHKQDKFFAAETTPINVATALDDVINGKVQATVVDGAAWDNFKWLNPVRANKLKTLMQSETFPTGVIAYKEGNVMESDLKKFRDGLTSAHQRPEGLQLMMLWKMNRFDAVPADYQQLLSDIVRAYPAPIGEEP